MTTHEDDYVFRFKIDPVPEVSGDMDPLTETVRIFLDDFLKLGFLTSEGKRIRVDGFSFLNDKDTIHRIF